ncbi:MAG: hypothetical protein NC043_07425 [Muribaculaceae bacterium]|nr:hypothetical protein [Muribaculaceae bacterium]
MKSAILTGAAMMMLLASCNSLSDRAKEMIGNYYIDEVTTDVPLLELCEDGTVLQRAIKPGVLTYTVKGKWNVLRDTLYITNDTVPVAIEGDASLVGNIPEKRNLPVVDFNGVTLTLRNGGADYVYHRRGMREED